ncbi:MAG: FtsX-like permease family protein [Acidobacteriota bacterium]|nr:FtsX-like permease family protein [Acidobacteriota bacterium]
MTSLALAWRGMTRQPARSALAVVGIAAVGALLFDMLLLSRGLVVSFGEILESSGYDIRVTPTAAIPGAGPPLENVSSILSDLERLPELDEIVAMRFGRGVARADGSGDVVLSLMGIGPGGAGSWSIVEGEPLGTVGEDGRLPIVINRSVAELVGLEPGDSLELAGYRRDTLAPPPKTFRVDGIAEFVFDRWNELTAVTSLAAYGETLGEPDHDQADLILAETRDGLATDEAVTAITRLRPELHAFSNEALLARLRQTDFSYFRQISFALTTITLFFAFLLVATLLTVSVNQRFAEIATLRALGFPRRRVVAGLLWESALLVGSGGLLALPAGWLLALRLDAILRAMPDIPERLHFFVFQPRALVEYAVLIGVTGVLAALYPVYLAARLPIARTLRNEVVG